MREQPGALRRRRPRSTSAFSPRPGRARRAAGSAAGGRRRPALGSAPAGGGRNGRCRAGARGVSGRGRRLPALPGGLGARRSLGSRGGPVFPQQEAVPGRCALSPAGAPRHSPSAGGERGARCRSAKAPCGLSSPFRKSKRSAVQCRCGPIKTPGS